MPERGMSGGGARLAVITGAHPFDVVGFHDLLARACAGTAVPYVQHLEDLAHASTEQLLAYQGALFYCFPQRGPGHEQSAPQESHPHAAIERLLDAGRGMVVLHHALLAYPDWPVWDAVVGASGRGRFSYHPRRTIEVTIADPAHPITAGLPSWRMVDETYCMPEPEGTPLLRVEHPDSMATIGWTRRCGRSRVVCLQSGHDGDSWSATGFQRVLMRAIAWCTSADAGVEDSTIAGHAAPRAQPQPGSFGDGGRIDRSQAAGLSP